MREGEWSPSLRSRRSASFSGTLAGASRPAEGAPATILGIGALLFAAIGVVVQLKDALNVVWWVEQSEKGGIWQFACIVLSFAAL